MFHVLMFLDLLGMRRKSITIKTCVTAVLVSQLLDVVMLLAQLDPLFFLQAL